MLLFRLGNGAVKKKKEWVLEDSVMDFFPHPYMKTCLYLNCISITFNFCAVTNFASAKGKTVLAKDF